MCMGECRIGGCYYCVVDRATLGSIWQTMMGRHKHTYIYTHRQTHRHTERDRGSIKQLEQLTCGRATFGSMWQTMIDTHTRTHTDRRTDRARAHTHRTHTETQRDRQPDRFSN